MLSAVDYGNPDPRTVEGTRCLVEMFYVLKRAQEAKPDKVSRVLVLQELL